jgi:hypothetical protein
MLALANSVCYTQHTSSTTEDTAMLVKDLIAQLQKLEQNAEVEVVAEDEELNVAITEVEQVVGAEDSNDGAGLVFLYCTAINEL